jgi:hypothetical protein
MPITTKTIQQLDAAIAAVKSTPSTKVEWNAASASLRQVVLDIRAMFLERGIFYVETIAEMQALSSLDTTFVHVNGVGASNGIYSFRNSVGTPNYITSFPASGSGLWVLVTVNTP